MPWEDDLMLREDERDDMGFRSGFRTRITGMSRLKSPFRHRALARGMERVKERMRDRVEGKAGTKMKTCR